MMILMMMMIKQKRLRERKAMLFCVLFIYMCHDKIRKIKAFYFDQKWNKKRKRKL